MFKYTLFRRQVLLLTVLIKLILCSTVNAYNIRHIENVDGLSNSAVLSLHQDLDGFVWFGTVDGLNRYDGAKIIQFRVNNELEQLSGNLIENIIETEKDIFWIHTNYGLDKVDKSGLILRHYSQFKGNFIMKKSHDNSVLIVNEDNLIYYLNNYTEEFIKIKVEGVDYNNILDMVITDTDIIQFFSMDSKNLRFSIDKKENGNIELNPLVNSTLSNKLLLKSCYTDEGNPNVVYMIDTSDKFYEYNVISNRLYYRCNLSELIGNKGSVNTIIKHHNDYFIGFKTGGLYILTYTGTDNQAYKITDVGIRSGIFCLMNDRYQDIVWIGTDGEGVFIYSNDVYSFKNVEYSKLNAQIASPTRAIYLDRNDDLWVGTKGDGILQVTNYDRSLDPKMYNVKYLNTLNSNLNDNTIYAFEESVNKKVLWIGTEDGLSYYSYNDKNIYNLDLTVRGEKIKYVHSICELNDSTLWLATVGLGIAKVEFEGRGSRLNVKEVNLIKVMDEKPFNNYFYTIYNEDYRTIWFGNRGSGIYRVDSYTFMMSNILLRSDGRNRSLNDVFAIVKDSENNFWFGTSAGLVKRSPNGSQKEFNIHDGFPNNVIHGIVHGQKNELWLSTNRGLICFNTVDETFQIYSTSNGLRIMEFSDGAFFKDDQSNTIFFGGINGFVSFFKSGNSNKGYFPDIQLDNLSIYGETKLLRDYINIEENTGLKVLNLNDDERSIALSFIAPDYMNGNNYSYHYKLGDKAPWIDNVFSNVFTFSDLQAGSYDLYVKYINKLTGEESKVSQMRLVIHPPWYLSGIAKGGYIVLFIVALYSFYFWVLGRNKKRNKQEVMQLTQKHKEDSYESKLQFFTNIAHEFCTPLTLIYGPCNEILSYHATDQFVKRNANIIQRNTEKLNHLIQELIEFQNVESGIRPLIIEQIDVSEYTDSIINSFTHLFDSKSITLSQNVDQDLRWNTDASFLQTILTNLLSNAYLHTPDNGVITFAVYVENNQLNVLVANTGKGIRQEYIDTIFDRYSILDALEFQVDQEGSSRNRLGLAITNSMVLALDGEIEVESALNDRTLFKVRLPFMTKENITHSESIRMQMTRRVEDMPIVNIEEKEWNPLKKAILIVDSDIETLAFMYELFVDEYNVIAKQNSKEMSEMLLQQHPDIIICDYLASSSSQTLEAIRQIKSDKSTAHIPLIITSTQQSVEEHIVGLDIGAEMFVTKPFNTDYIKKAVQHLLYRKSILKDYFNSPISAFDLTDSRLVHKENSKFSQEMLSIIETHITDPELSTKFIAEKLNISPRHLYRKLREIQSDNPVDIIRETRLNIARNLLLNTQLTVEEILYKCGFINKSTFFRQFSSKFGITPQAFREQELGQIQGNTE